ncbi:MAG: acyl-CoA thioesterase [Anaerolineaceae bacterium]|nr:acyl-CoA thioesterase [Anaerolineaceae bacterium]
MPPLTHTETFQVRHYECDAYGHLNNANYIRYMEEAAFAASAAAGYPKDRYEGMGYLWLARETEIEYLQQVRYGDILEIKTWVDDFRRVRSRRRYEFRFPGQDDLVAQASTDWVYIEAATLRPAVVPPEMIAGFWPGETPQPAPPRDKFPAAPPPPPGVFKLRRRVEWRDIDTAQHVNNAAYLNYLEDAGIQVMNAHHWPMKRAEEAGFAIIARKHRIEYRQAAVLDDEIEIATWVSGMKRSFATRHYTIHRAADNELLIQAQTLYVWIDLKTGRPIRVPQPFLDDFAPNIVNEA